MHKREVVLVKTCLCAQSRSCFGETPFVCTSVLIMCKRHTTLYLIDKSLGKCLIYLIYFKEIDAFLFILTPINQK